MAYKIHAKYNVNQSTKLERYRNLKRYWKQTNKKNVASRTVIFIFYACISFRLAY